MRRSKTLQQQAKYYEVANEVEMMNFMLASWTNGNFSYFKDYFKVLKKADRKRFLSYAWCNTEDREFYKMVDFLFF